MDGTLKKKMSSSLFVTQKCKTSFFQTTKVFFLPPHPPTHHHTHTHRKSSLCTRHFFFVRKNQFDKCRVSENMEKSLGRVPSGGGVKKNLQSTTIALDYTVFCEDENVFDELTFEIFTTALKVSLQTLPDKDTHEFTKTCCFLYFLKVTRFKLFLEPTHAHTYTPQHIWERVRIFKLWDE